MIQMWAALESMAARLATIRATDEEIAQLRHMFDNFRDDTPATHIEEYSEANIEFHQAIVQLAKSQIIFDTIRNIFVHVRANPQDDDFAERPCLALYRRSQCASLKRSRRATPNWWSGWCATIRSIWRVYVEANCDFLD